MSLPGIESLLRQVLGYPTDAASSTGTVNAKLAQLLTGVPQPVATFASYFATTIAVQGTGAVLIDTGALAAGDYAFIAQWAQTAQVTGAIRDGVAWQHRNAANGANIASAPVCGTVAGLTGGPWVSSNGYIYIPRKTFALNERLRLVKGAMLADDTATTGEQGGSLYVWKVS